MTVLADSPPRAPARALRLVRPTPLWWGKACWAVLVVGLAAVLSLWVSQGNVGGLTAGAGVGLTSLGRLLGLVASYLLLVQVLLLARVPMLERSFGQDRLARVHRWVGFGSFSLLLAHIPTMTIGYALTAGRNPFAEAWTLTWDYPGMLLALAGTGLLIAVVATSIRWARRRLRYESWHLLHLYSYLGVGLVLPHQLWTGGDFLANRAATVFWWTAWGLTAATIATYRVALPLMRTLRHQLVVHAVVAEAPGVVSVLMRGRHLDRLPARAGQFFLWRFLDGPGRTRAHPYSLSAPPDPSMLRITVKDLGDDSAWLANLRPGTRVAMEGPYGRMTAERRTRRGVLLLACGVGITPLRALAEEFDQGPGDVVLLHRVRSTSEAVFRDEFAELSRRTGLRVVHLTGPRAAGRTSFLPASWSAAPDGEALRRLVPDVARRDVYVCGPDDWARAARAAASEARVPAGRLHEERFSW